MKKILFLSIALVVFGTMPALAQKTTSTQIQYTRQKIRMKPHYQGEVNLGYSVGGRNFTFSEYWENGERSGVNSRIAVTTVHGYRVAKWFFVGAGVGVMGDFPIYFPKWDEDEKYISDISKGALMFVPIFANVKFYLPISDSFSLYATGSFGGSPVINGHKLYSGGYYGEYGLGLNYKRFTFDAGIQQQTINFDENRYATRYFTSDIDMIGAIFYFKVGMTF